MSRALPKYNKRRVAIIGGAVAVALTGAVVVNTALAGESKSGATNAQTLAAGPGTIVCPDVTSKLPAIPASAKAEVDRNLALLQTQIQEANTRLQNTVGQGGPNFVQNAILGPLKDKRVSTVNRIATAIGRTAAKPTGLDALAPCALNAGGAATGGGATAPATGNNGNNANAGNNGNAGNNANNGNNNAGNAGNAGAVGTISCPDVASQLPAVPASAQAEVDRNLALLQTQINEANTRLKNTVGQGGPNFVQNAILGPLQGKRESTIDRIAISIGRQGTKPQGLNVLAACTLNK
jgi:F0F1-type ATP synthase membrane subunit b/b'